MRPIFALLTLFSSASALCLTTPYNGCSGPLRIFCCPDDKHLAKPKPTPLRSSTRVSSSTIHPSSSTRPSSVPSATPSSVCATEPYKSHNHPDLQCCGYEYVGGPISCYAIEGPTSLQELRESKICKTYYSPSCCEAGNKENAELCEFVRTD